MQMQKLLLTIDRISTFVGQTFSWLIVSLTFMITWEVVSRYAFDNPHPWAFDVMIMMYGSVFMMAGAYTLSKNGHVRGDVLYGFFSPRVQASLDLTAVFPVLHSRVFALAWAGYNFAANPGPSTNIRTSPPTARRCIRSRWSCPWPAPSCCCRGWSRSSVA
jgi:TRAP-type mannitol/chloroaromatic compound transport system permease small subunit